MKRTPIPAYVNHGRWVADCPACRVGLQLPRGVFQVKAEFVFVGDLCLACQTPLQVVWPADVDLIDEALKDRPLINRNWWCPGNIQGMPPETVEDLHAENLLHMESV